MRSGSKIPLSGMAGHLVKNRTRTTVMRSSNDPAFSPSVLTRRLPPSTQPKVSFSLCCLTFCASKTLLQTSLDWKLVDNICKVLLVWKNFGSGVWCNEDAVFHFQKFVMHKVGHLRSLFPSNVKDRKKPRKYVSAPPDSHSVTADGNDPSKESAFLILFQT